MKTKLLFWVAVLVGIGVLFSGQSPAKAGEIHSASGYKVLAPIRYGNLTVFPVVGQKAHDTGDFLTLDEGLRSGEVVVSEYGSIRPLIRRGPFRQIPDPAGGAQVNRLVLVNNAKRPLLLLAGGSGSRGEQRGEGGADREVPAGKERTNTPGSCLLWARDARCRTAHVSGDR